MSIPPLSPQPPSSTAMTEMNSLHGGKKTLSDMELAMVLHSDSDDDRPPEIVIMPSVKANGGGETEKGDIEYQKKSDYELRDTLSKNKSYISTLGSKLPDKGAKLKATIRRCEAELERRNKIHENKGGIKCGETIQLSDQSAFAKSFTKKMSEDASYLPKSLRTGNAFQEEMSFISPPKGRNTNPAQLFRRARSTQQLSSRSKPFGCLTALVNTKKHKKCDRIFNHSVNSATFPLGHFSRDKQDFISKKLGPQDQPSTKSRPKIFRGCHWYDDCYFAFFGPVYSDILRPSSCHLVDEDIEEPDVCNLTVHEEELSDCMKDVKVYYPSRDDQDPVEVTYTDMKCLAPEACLSSTIMNFYIRYLQQPASSSENAICNFHFFNTYFYNKLQKLKCSEDSFLKFRKWWKRVNIFEKAYILFPVHENAHWSLGIICIPTKEDELGPIVLHLDSLGLHDSKAISNNVRSFLEREWSYLQKSEDPLYLPIVKEIWENLDDRIIDRKMPVPQQRNAYDCGLFVLFYMEKFIKEAPERLAEKNLSMFSKQWFRPEEASNLRARIHNLLVQEFKISKEKETTMSPNC